MCSWSEWGIGSEDLTRRYAVNRLTRLCGMNRVSPWLGIRCEVAGRRSWVQMKREHYKVVRLTLSGVCILLISIIGCVELSTAAYVNCGSYLPDEYHDLGVIPHQPIAPVLATCQMNQSIILRFSTCRSSRIPIFLPSCAAKYVRQRKSVAENRN